MRLLLLDAKGLLQGLLPLEEEHEEEEDALEDWDEVETTRGEAGAAETTLCPATAENDEVENVEEEDAECFEK